MPPLQFAPTNGIRMGYYEAGPVTDTPPVILCHGWPEIAFSWRHQIKALAAEGRASAIILSSLVWTGLHLQYDWYFFGEVFTLGLWFGYLRYRSGSTWLTIVLHGLNNFAAVIQTIWLAGQG